MTFNWKPLVCLLNVAGFGFYSHVAHSATLPPLYKGTVESAKSHTCGYDLCNGTQWVIFGGKFYKYYADLKTFDGAEAKCKEDSGGNLVSIHTVDERKFVSEYTNSCNSDNYWIGMRDPSNNIVLASWTDGSPIDYKHVINFLYQDNKCVGVHQGEWTDAACAMKRPFVCSKPLGKAVLPAFGTCDRLGQWLDFRGKKYLHPCQLEDFYSAERSCNLLGGQLTSVHSSAELEFIKSIVMDAGRCLQGSKFEGASLTWIGMEDPNDSSEGLRWTDGSPTDFSRGFPLIKDPNHKCVAVDQNTGQWSDQDCNLKGRFICKFRWQVTDRWEVSNRMTSSDGQTISMLVEQARTSPAAKHVEVISRRKSTQSDCFIVCLQESNCSYIRFGNATDKLGDCLHYGTKP